MALLSDNSSQADKLDAERYRFLKSLRHLELSSTRTRWIRKDGTPFIQTHYLSGDNIQFSPDASLDETIDRAMKDHKRICKPS